MGTVSRVMAGCFSMAAFAVAIIAGLTSENPAVLVLGRALLAMIICYPIGLIVGAICQRVITLHMQEYEGKHPVPSEGDDEHENDIDNERDHEQTTAGGNPNAEEVLVV